MSLTNHRAQSTAGPTRADQMIQWLRNYADQRLNSRLIDERRTIPPSVVLDFGNQGLLGMHVAPAYGGLGLTLLDTLRVLQQVAAIDLTLAIFVATNILGARLIERHAQPAVRNQLLPRLAAGRELAAFAVTEPGAGSNPAAMTAQATPTGDGGWELTGVKKWIGSAAWASAINVFAQLSDAAGNSLGITGFVVPQGTPGLRIGPEAVTLGLRGMVQNTLYFDGVPVQPEQLLGEPGQGLAIAQETMMFTRLCLAAICIGGMKRCLQLMHRYASRRTVATGLLLANPVTLVRMSELTAAITALDALVTWSATAMEEGGPAPGPVLLAGKVLGSEFLWQAADTLVQVLGGRGYEENNVAPQILRDARVFRIFEGPTETLTMYLGSLVCTSDDVQQWLSNIVASPLLASRLQEAVQQIQTRNLAASAPFTDPAAALTYAYALAGEVALDAFLLAASERALQQTPSAPVRQATNWAQQRFEESLRRALTPLPAAAVCSDATRLTALIATYAETIGDIEQSLPGVDEQLDPLLHRTPPAAGLAPTRITVAEFNNFSYEMSPSQSDSDSHIAPATETLTHDQAAGSAPAAKPPILSAAERQRILVERNKTQVDFPLERCVHQLVEAQVQRTPDAEAVVFQGQRLTYRELNAQANQLAHALQAHGVGPETLVGICMERSLEMIVALLGVLKAGGAYVPLDPTYPPERLRYMVEDAQIKLLITQAGVAKRLSMPAETRVFCLDSEQTQIASQPTTDLASGVQSNNLAYVIYTSGSTGKPKGVMLEHRGLVNLALAEIERFGLQPGCRVLQVVSFGFDVATSDWAMTLCAGATLCLAPEDARLPGPALLQLLHDQAITHMELAVSILAALPDAELPALQTLIVGGEVCPAELVARWAPGRRFFNAYGPTEATVCTTLAECRADGGKPPIGRPLANTQVYILDDQRQPVPDGETGELYIGGVGVARGYLRRPDLTAEKFVANPFSSDSGARLYKTGDLARYLPDGNIDFCGRVDNQVKIRGFRIELEEIERVLAEHPLVRQAAVVPYEAAPGDKRLVAYVVAAGEPDPLLAAGSNHLTAAMLRPYLKERLPEYMVPAEIVPLTAMPVTPNGKIDRRALPAPEQSSQPAEDHVIAPNTPTQQRLATIWRSVLHRQSIGIYDDFFDLGGHSLLAAQIISRTREAFQLNISPSTLFEARTIAGLADCIEQLRPLNGSQEKSTHFSPDNHEEFTL